MELAGYLYHESGFIFLRVFSRARIVKDKHTTIKHTESYLVRNLVVFLPILDARLSSS